MAQASEGHQYFANNCFVFVSKESRLERAINISAKKTNFSRQETRVYKNAKLSSTFFFFAENIYFLDVAERKKHSGMGLKERTLNGAKAFRITALSRMTLRRVKLSRMMLS